MPTTFTGNFNFATLYINPSTAIAPHLSKTIRPIFSAGLIETPPVSKVMALPTTRRGEDRGSRVEDRESRGLFGPRFSTFDPRARCSSTIIRGGGRFDPGPTAENP